MGMLITEIKTIPEKYLLNPQELFDQIHLNAELETRDDEDGFEHKVICGLVNENTFESWWREQENIEPSQENKMKYLERAKQGRLCYIQTDID
jgi:hypothetical protein